MTALENSTSEIISTVAKVRATYNARVTRPLEWRRAQLKAMIAMLEENESRWSDALRQELGKPRPTTRASRAPSSGAVRS